MRALASHSNRPVGLWDAGCTVVPLRGPVSKCRRKRIIQGGDVPEWESKGFKNSQSHVSSSQFSGKIGTKLWVHFTKMRTKLMRGRNDGTRIDGACG